MSLPLALSTITRLLQDSTPWLSCDDCTKLVDRYAEERVFSSESTFGPASTALAMDVHLLSCDSCAEEAESLIELLRDDLRSESG